MDVNETRFQLLLGYEDWANCSATADGQQPLRQQWEQPLSQASPAEILWEPATSELTLQPYTALITGAELHMYRRLNERRGADRDRHGNWYWIDDTTQTLLCQISGSGEQGHFWSPRAGLAYEQGTSAPAPHANKIHDLSLSGLTITEDQYLLVGTRQPAGLLIFDLLGGGLPRHILWPSTVAFAPYDMAPMPGGGAWILDREHSHYWAIDRFFNIVQHEQETILLAAEQANTFQPLAGEPLRYTTTQTFPTGISLQTISAIAPGDAAAIEALPDGTVLILVNTPDEPFSKLYRYYFAQQLGTPVSTESVCSLIEKDKQAQFHLHGYDFAFVPEHHDASDNLISDRLYIVPQESNQVYAFSLRQDHEQLSLQPLPNYFPLRFFSGRRLVASYHQLYYDFANTWLPLVEQQRPRYNPTATFYTPLGEPRHALDGKTPACTWHRLLLDASIPPETTVSIWSRAADMESELLTAPWNAEPSLHLRSDGSELPFVENPTGEGNGTWEVLLQAASGRYLQLKIQLLGNARLTPRLRAMRIYYPRFSYLEQYLPAVYREDRQSAAFLDRFLANFEGTYTALEGKIAAVQMLFDTRSIPSEALPWLAEWLGLALNLSWNANKQRFFLKHAMAFFHLRGTINGLLISLQLAFDSRPAGPQEDTLADYLLARSRVNTIRIIERFRLRSMSGALAGDPDSAESSLGQESTEHQFSVLLPLPKDGTAAEHYQQLELAKHILEKEKPAHTLFEVKFYQAIFRVGTIRLGIDTFVDLGSRTNQLIAPLVLGQDYLFNTYLADREPQDLLQRNVIRS